MYIKDIKPEDNDGKGLKVTPKLIKMVVKEVKRRMTGDKKGGPFKEPLDQIILNQYTAIKLKDEEVK